jgi:hypothetical protein
MRAKTLKRVLASAFIVAGGAAICSWVWPDDGSFLFSSLAVMSAVLSLVVVVSLWHK